jgi:hypothetical protein
MTPMADMIRSLSNAGCSIEQIIIAVEGHELANQVENRVDKAAQRRREWDREYRRKRSNSTRIPPDQVEGAYIDSSLLTKKESISRRAQRIPPDWSLSAANKEWAIKVGVPFGEVVPQSEKFKDWWLAKAGKDGTKLDWDATWRTWCRNFLERRGINGKKIDHMEGIL